MGQVSVWFSLTFTVKILTFAVKIHQWMPRWGTPYDTAGGSACTLRGQDLSWWYFLAARLFIVWPQNLHGNLSKPLCIASM